MKEYNHLKIEPKWRKYWDKKGINKTTEGSKKPKTYVLDMFPYPSGDGLHVGHPRGYIATDVYSRFKRMQGFNVLHPMGWDAFGLPAENYAIKNKISPDFAMKRNVKRFKEQINIIGLNYDWSREINTTDPNYYKWTQWIFLQMFKKGLAYESYEPINWCPSCKTGLSNEDVEDGKCERCSTIVEKKPMRQWVLKITNYADRLLKDIDALNWPGSIKESQRNWIGRSEGALLKFKFEKSNLKTKEIEVFTTRADTLFGVTYVVLAPENKLVQELKPQIKNWKDVEKYITEARSKTEIERTAINKAKTGVELKGVSVINPANNENVPVWIADYVLNDYGTGAVMAVPAHDERDFAFAKKYNLPIKQVIAPHFIEPKNPPQAGRETKRRKTIHVILERKSDGKILVLDWIGKEWGTRRPHTFIIGGIEENEDVILAAKREIEEETGYINITETNNLNLTIHSEYHAAHKQENRYADISLLHFILDNEEQKNVDPAELKKHTPQWIEKKELLNFINVVDGPFEIDWFTNGRRAIIEDGILLNSGKFNNLDSEQARKEITKAFGKEKVSYKLKDWVFSRQRYWGEPIPVVHCETCGVVAVPEKELPVKLPKVKFYEPTGTGESPLAAISKWVNTKCPECSEPAKRETNTMPQWAGSSWYYLRYIDPKNKKALVDKKREKYWMPVDLYVGGAEHATRHLIYARFWHKFLYDIGVVSGLEPFSQLKNLGMILGADNRKMSKRWGNVVNPDEVVKNVGADTLRVYEMFMGPFDQEIVWSTDNMVGSRRFLDKVWRIGQNFLEKRFSPLNGVPNRFEDVSKENFEILLNKTIKKVTDDILNFGFNTAISAFMILINAAEKTEIGETDYEIILKLLAPFAPHMTEEIWASLGHKKSIHLEQWPEYDRSKIVSERTSIIVQINGKVRASFEVDKGAKQEEVEKIAFAREDVTKWLAGKVVKKKMFLKEKVLTIITD